MKALLLPLVLASFVFLSSVKDGSAGITSSFIRSQWPSTDIPLDHEAFAVPKGYNAPQQVHITQGDYDGKAVIISWVTTDEAGPSKVEYGTSENKFQAIAQGKSTNYTFHEYKSGFIHQCLIEGLEYETKYYYRIGSGDSSREFWFETPPKVDPDASYKFGIIGDLGQTFNSLSITCRVEHRVSYFLEIFHRLIDTNTMMSVCGGIHGADLLKKVQHIIHGFYCSVS